MAYYAVHTDYTDPLKPIHIKDKRKLSQIGRELMENGYIASNAVTIRQAVTGYNDGENTTTQHFFSTDKQGDILFLIDHVRHIAEVVVPKGALPMPEE